MKRIIVCALLLFSLAETCFAAGAPFPVSADTFSLQAESAVLMKKTTGTVIYEKNPCLHLAPASVTKVMTMLLVVEAIEGGGLRLDDVVTASAHARSMGGSQIWLEDGEQMSVSDMLKCVAVVSANDCAVALAEHLSGSEEAFVARMNSRAAELGCADTHFTNCTGLFDDEDHYTCARDLAVISRALISHELIKSYTTIWTDSVRGGEFGLSNTNKLIRYYAGATGLKTGYTSKAGHCLAATAERDGVEYIAVVMKGVNSAARFEAAKTLLSYAFANCTLADLRPEAAIAPIPVDLGTADAVQPVCDGPVSMLLEKSRAAALQYDVQLPERVEAPVRSGDALGKLIVRSGSETVCDIPLVAADDIYRMGTFQIFLTLFRIFVGKNQADTL